MMYGIRALTCDSRQMNPLAFMAIRARQMVCARAGGWRHAKVWLVGAGTKLKRQMRSEVRNKIFSGLDASRQIPCGDELYQTGCRGQQQ